MLEESYSTFSVNQRTLSVSPSQYEQARAAARDDRVDVYVKVENENAEVLHMVDGEALTLPSTTAAADGSIELSVRSAVENATGVACSITAVERATILGISNAEDDCGTIYRLAILFEAIQEGGAANEDAVWQRTAQPPQPIEA